MWFQITRISTAATKHRKKPFYFMFLLTLWNIKFLITIFLQLLFLDAFEKLQICVFLCAFLSTKPKINLVIIFFSKTCKKFLISFYIIIIIICLLFRVLLNRYFRTKRAPATRANVLPGWLKGYHKTISVFYFVVVLSRG